MKKASGAAMIRRAFKRVCAMSEVHVHSWKTNNGSNPKWSADGRSATPEKTIWLFIGKKHEMEKKNDADSW